MDNERKVPHETPPTLPDDGLGQVVAQYDMYINRPEKRLMLLQYPNRDPGQPYSNKTGLKPLELRIKPKCGLVEVDVPLIVHTNFDSEKGVIYGQAMRKSRILQEGGSYGLTGGMRPNVGKFRHEQAIDTEELSKEMLLENFDDANNKGHVLNKLTLGGQIVPWKEGDPIYMLGVFKGSSIYLSKLDAMVQLRPQFTHLDALKDQDKILTTAKSLQNVANPPGESEARDVNLIAKSTEVEEVDMYRDMGQTVKLLKGMREESWQRLAWVDSENEQSYAVFNSEMMIHDPAKAPNLVSAMTDQQWLDAISCPRIDPTNQGKKVFRMSQSDIDSSSESSNGQSDEEVGPRSLDKDGREVTGDVQAPEKEDVTMNNHDL